MLQQSQPRHLHAVGTELSNTIAAVFATEHDAREAIKGLHKAGFRKTWLGTIGPADRSSGQASVEEAGRRLARFISGEASKRTLESALAAQGVSDEQISDIEGDVAPGCAMLTVYAEDNPARVEAILIENNGSVFGTASSSPTAVEIASANPRTGVEKPAGGNLVAEYDDSQLQPLDTAAPYTRDSSVHDHAVEEFYENRASMR